MKSPGGEMTEMRAHELTRVLRERGWRVKVVRSLRLVKFRWFSPEGPSFAGAWSANPRTAFTHALDLAAYSGAGAHVLELGFRATFAKEAKAAMVQATSREQGAGSSGLQLRAPSFALPSLPSPSSRELCS